MNLKRSLNTTALLAGALATLAMSAGALAAAQQPGAKPTADETRAIQIVTEFVTNLRKDANKALSLVDDNIVWRGDSREKDLSHGKDSVAKMVNMFANPDPKMAQMFSIKGIDILDSHAYGGTYNVLVINRRIDHGVFNGKERDELVGGFFRVNTKSGKIEEWLEAPLNITEPLPGGGPGGPGGPGGAPGGPGGFPAGGPPAGGPPPGGAPR